MLHADLSLGTLVPVLPHCSARNPAGEICLFYSDRELLPVRSRTFVDFCVEFFREGGLYACPDEAGATMQSVQI
jgi:DNA-binding transcriptional LysR family regulator